MNRFARTLEVLIGAGVDLVVIGGVAHAVQGGTHLTYDLDICYGRSAANVARLAKALEPHHPRLRGVVEELPFVLDSVTISRGLNFTLTTDLGDLDLFGEVAGLGAYDRVRDLSKVVPLFGFGCRVLSVEGLVRAKRAAARTKDLLVLPELEALLEVESRLKAGHPKDEHASELAETED
jgi:hypothetical protein